MRIRTRESGATNSSTRYPSNLDRHGYSDYAIHVEDAYNWCTTPVSSAPVRAIVETRHEFGFEPAIWPYLASSAPSYPLTNVPKTPVARGAVVMTGRCSVLKVSPGG